MNLDSSSCTGSKPLGRRSTGSRCRACTGHQHGHQICVISSFWGLLQVVLGYSPYHLFANTAAGARFANKTRQAIAFERLRSRRTHVIVYTGGYFDIFETLSFVHLTLVLSPSVQTRLRHWLEDQKHCMWIMATTTGAYSYYIGCPTGSATPQDMMNSQSFAKAWYSVICEGMVIA